LRVADILVSRVQIRVVRLGGEHHSWFRKNQVRQPAGDKAILLLYTWLAVGLMRMIFPALV